jgi:hypothetical protein
MNILKLSKKSLFVLLLSLMALVMLPACSSTEETADTGTAPTGDSSSGDSDMTCDEGDSRDECINDIL